MIFSFCKGQRTLQKLAQRSAMNPVTLQTYVAQKAIEYVEENDRVTKHYLGITVRCTNKKCQKCIILSEAEWCDSCKLVFCKTCWKPMKRECTEKQCHTRLCKDCADNFPKRVCCPSKFICVGQKGRKQYVMDVKLSFAKNVGLSPYVMVVIEPTVNSVNAGIALTQG